MVNWPATEKKPRMRARPLASSVTRATAVLPTKNVTVPVGVPFPDGSRTVAVNVTGCPTTTGLADANRARVVALRVGAAFTCSVRDCELPRNIGPPLKTAVMVCPPEAAKLVVNVAVPLVPTLTVPRTTLPSLKVTVPVVDPAAGATAATLAVKVTAWPVTAGLTDDDRVSVVAAGLTVTATAAESLAAKPLTPKKEAVSEWVPTNSDVGRVARPVASSGAEPRNVWR